MRLFVEHKARDGSVLLLTISECIILNHLRDNTPFIPQAKFPMVEEAIERLGKLTAEHQ